MRREKEMGMLTFSRSLIGWSVCSLFYLYQYVLQTAPSVMSSDLMRRFSIDALGFGHLSALYFYAYMIMQIYSGMLIDCIGVQRTLVGSAVICAAGACLFSMTNHLFLVEMARVIMGAAGACAFIGASKFVAVQFRSDQVALYIGITESVGYFGAIISGVMTSRAADQFGWSVVLFYIAVVGFFIAIMLGLSVDGSVCRQADQNGEASKRSGVMLLLNQRGVWFYSILASMLCVPIPAIACLWGPFFLVHVFSLSNTTAASVNSFIFTGLIVGCPLASMLSCRFGLKTCLQVGCGGCFFCFVILSVAPSTISVYALCGVFFLVGFFCSVFVLIFDYVQRYTIRFKATAISFVNMMSLMVGVLLQPVMGYLFSCRFGWQGQFDSLSAVSYRLPLAVVLVCLAVAVLMSFKIKQNEVVIK